jgi:hypothetical protein
MALLARVFFYLAFLTFVVGVINRFSPLRDSIWFISNVTFLYATSALALLGLLCGVIRLIELQERPAPAPEA